ncbi:MAG: hypothetical protein IJ936_02840, partial [Peptococcaceae bacterium]|nr:hypothetical protein [Peptococcaceae bacterium]
DILFITGFIRSLNGFITTESTGIGTFCEETVGYYLQGFSPVFFVIIVIVISVIAANIVSNAVTAIVMISVVPILCAQLGIISTPILVMIIIAAHTAFITPASFAAMAIVFGMKEWMSNKYYIYAIITAAFLAIIEVVIGYPLACLFN